MPQAAAGLGLGRVLANVTASACTELDCTTRRGALEMGSWSAGLGGLVADLLIRGGAKPPFEAGHTGVRWLGHRFAAQAVELPDYDGA